MSSFAVHFTPSSLFYTKATDRIVSGMTVEVLLLIWLNINSLMAGVLKILLTEAYW